MVTSAFSVYENNYGLPIIWTLYQSDGVTPFNLTNYTVKFKMWKPVYPDTLKIDRECDIIDAPNGIVQFVPIPTDFDTPGYYYAQFQASVNGIVVVGFNIFPWNVISAPS